MLRLAVSCVFMSLFCLAILPGCSRALDVRYSELQFDKAQWKAERYVWINHSTGENMAKELMEKLSEEEYHAVSIDDLVEAFRGCGAEKVVVRVSKTHNRGKMIGDLLKNHLQPGMLKESVEELLGHPDSSPLFKSGLERWSYALSYEGFEHLFDADMSLSGSHYFYLFFDKEGKYMKYEIELI